MFSIMCKDLFTQSEYGSESEKDQRINDKHQTKLQGLFVPFARVGSSDPLRVLRLLHNKYTGYH